MEAYQAAQPVANLILDSLILDSKVISHAPDPVTSFHPTILLALNLAACFGGNSDRLETSYS
jgi:hypothetical protein